MFKECIKEIKATFADTSGFNGKDHPSVIEVLFSYHMFVDEIKIF